MRPASSLLLLAALLSAAPAYADSPTRAPKPGSRYVLLDVPYTASGARQTYTTPTRMKADPWAFSRGLLTLMGVQGSSWDFQDAGGRVLRVTTPGGAPTGLYRVTYEPALTRTWRGRAWAYGGLNYACRFGLAESVVLRLLPEQPLQVTRVYRVQGRHPGVFHRNTFGAGTLFSDEPVASTDPLLVEFSVAGWKAQGGSGASLEAIQRNEKLAPAVCKVGFLPLLDQGGLGHSLSRDPLPTGLDTKRWQQPRGQAGQFFRGWTRREVHVAFGSPDEPGTPGQVMRLGRWSYRGPAAEFYAFTFRNDRVVGVEETHMP